MHRMVADKEIVKLVVAGPVNAGKSTLIRSVSDIPVLCTNEMATDDVAELKTYTTVAMDHGLFYAGENREIHLYGTPGQRRFDFMWEILAVGADGIVLLVDGSDPASVNEISYILDHFNQQCARPVIVGVSRHDAVAARHPDSIAAHLGIDPGHVMTVDPRNPDDAKLLLLNLCNRLGQRQSAAIV